MKWAVHVGNGSVAKNEVKGKGRLKREATEAALIDAFARVVQRSGLRSVGVNEVIKEKVSADQADLFSFNVKGSYIGNHPVSISLIE